MNVFFPHLPERSFNVALRTLRERLYHLKGTVHPKINVYSPSCLSKPIWLSFFVQWKIKQIFRVQSKSVGSKRIAWMGTFYKHDFIFIMSYDVSVFVMLRSMCMCWWAVCVGSFVLVVLSCQICVCRFNHSLQLTFINSSDAPI